jgi:hypothetical protein
MTPKQIIEKVEECAKCGKPIKDWNIFLGGILCKECR